MRVAHPAIATCSSPVLHVMLTRSRGLTAGVQWFAVLGHLLRDASADLVGPRHGFSRDGREGLEISRPQSDPLQVWPETPIRDTSCCYHPLTDVSCLRLGPRSQASRATPAAGYEAPAMRRRYYRHLSHGGWPFSTAAHGWPISDCTAEGLKAVLALRVDRGLVGGLSDKALASIPDQRLFAAVEVLLTLQNSDGGWATYENNRGYGWYETLNPSEVFGDIMIDYSYVVRHSARARTHTPAGECRLGVFVAACQSNWDRRGGSAGMHRRRDHRAR